MDRSLRRCDSRRQGDWVRVCCIAAVLVFATAGGVLLAVSSEPFDGSWLRGRRQHVADTLPDQEADVIGPVTAGSGTGDSHTARGMQEQEWEESWRNHTLGDGLLKQYSSFAKYALESSKGVASLPVPVVKPIGQKSAVSIPIITIIGVQKGGTTSLRGNLLTHPMVWGMQNEVHFFDLVPSRYPKLGHWEGDGLDQDIGIGAVGRILSEYAKACVSEGRTFSQKHSGTFRTDRVIVESSPRYIFSPIAPYRIQMVRPGAKFVIVLRDPTDRYVSQLRMAMCKRKPDKSFASVEEMISTFFHPPGGAKGYLARADEGYEPYTALCRGENASATDLWRCYQAVKVFNPLYRGLYADQLERWFRVFDRSQIMVIDSSEMFKDFTGVVTAVANFAGLPEHDFKYDPSHEFKGGGCDKRRHRHHPDFFAEGGRYETMVEEVDLFREWYRPHNERLYKLLGRELAWR